MLKRMQILVPANLRIDIEYTYTTFRDCVDCIRSTYKCSNKVCFDFVTMWIDILFRE